MGNFTIIVADSNILYLLKTDTAAVIQIRNHVAAYEAGDFFLLAHMLTKIEDNNELKDKGDIKEALCCGYGDVTGDLNGSNFSGGERSVSKERI
ncbi:unnamed protein product [Caretta caretta]